MAGAAGTKEEEDKDGVGGAAGGFWEFESGVEGESANVPPASSPLSSSLSSEDSVRGLAKRVVFSRLDTDGPPTCTLCSDFKVGVVAWPFTFTVGLESGCSSAAANESTTRPLLIPLLVMFVLSHSLCLSGVDCGPFTVPPDVFPVEEVGVAAEEASTRGSEDAADSWSVLLPTFMILDSVDLCFDKGGMGAYSCADGMGGEKKGDPGDGKGDEEDSLVTATESKGLSGKREAISWGG